MGLEWIADAFLSVATPVQLALPRLLAARHAFRARVAERLAANRVTLEAMGARRPEMTVLDAEGGWSAVLRVPRIGSDEEWALELGRRGVLRNGLTWHFNRPPVVGLDYEMDCRCVHTERVV